MGDGVETRCSSCGYKWEYTGDLQFCTCPNCNAKVMNKYNPDHPKHDPEKHTQNFLNIDDEESTAD